MKRKEKDQVKKGRKCKSWTRCSFCPYMTYSPSRIFDHWKKTHWIGKKQLQFPRNKDNTHSCAVSGCGYKDLKSSARLKDHYYTDDPRKDGHSWLELMKAGVEVWRFTEPKTKKARAIIKYARSKGFIYHPNYPKTIIKSVYSAPKWLKKRSYELYATENNKK